MCLSLDVDSVEEETVIDSGGTGGGVLIDGKECSGCYCTVPATLEDGRDVELTATHFFDDSGELIQVDAEISNPGHLAGLGAEGPAVIQWIENLTEEYSSQ